MTIVFKRRVGETVAVDSGPLLIPGWQRDANAFLLKLFPNPRRLFVVR